MPTAETHWQQMALSIQRHTPFFAGLDQRWLPPAAGDWPDIDVLSRTLQSRVGVDYPVKGFVKQAPHMRYSAAEYERLIHQRGYIPTRSESAHDFFNALCWLRWPASKQAINPVHIRELDRTSTSADTRLRSRCRDAVTLLDESGVLVLSDQPQLLQALAQHRWQAPWIEQRQQWATHTRCLMFGHGLLEQCLSPYVGLTAKALLVHVDSHSLNDEAALDAWLARQISSGAFHHPHQLSPLPLLGVPGFWPDNTDPDFYANSDYFRPPSRRRPAAPVWRLSCRT